MNYQVSLANIFSVERSSQEYRGFSHERFKSFSKDKHEKFCRCPKCYEETKHKKLRDEELVFGEVLDKELKK